MFRNIFKKLTIFCEKNRLPEDLRSELHDFLLLKFNAREEHREIVDEFPPVFRARLFRYMYRPLVEQSYLLQNAGPTFIDLLATELHMEVFLPGVTVLTQADAPLSMYFVVSGCLSGLLAVEQMNPGEPAAGDDLEQGAAANDDVTSAEQLCVCEYRRSDVFGELAVVFGLQQPFTVCGQHLCRLLGLKAERWKAMEASHPRETALVRLHALHRRRPSPCACCSSL